MNVHMRRVNFNEREFLGKTTRCFKTRFQFTSLDEYFLTKVVVYKRFQTQRLIEKWFKMGFHIKQTKEFAYEGI